MRQRLGLELSGTRITNNCSFLSVFSFLNDMECNSLDEFNLHSVSYCLNMKIERGNWRIYPFLREFHRLKNEFHHISWSWISREANRAADAAAKLAKVRLCTVNWTNCPPTSIILILQNDGLPGPP